MNIDGSGPISHLIQDAKEGEKSQKIANPAPQQQRTKTGPSDTVTLTHTAAQLQQLEQAIASSPIVNSHRVEQMQQAVNDGHINIDPTQLADKVLSFESELNSVRTGV